MKRFIEIMMELLLVVMFVTVVTWGIGVVLHSEGLLQAGTGVLFVGMLGIFGIAALVYAAMFFGLPLAVAIYRGLRAYKEHTDLEF